MKILVDPQIFWWQHYGGISRYFTELIKNIEANSSIELLCPILFHNNAHLGEYQLFKNKRHHSLLNKILKFKGAGIVRRVFLNNKRYASNFIKNYDFDILICTFYDDYFLDHLNGRPFVIIVHDMIMELFPHYNKDFPNIVTKKRKLLNLASGIVTVSNKTKKDLLHIYEDVDAHKIEVIHHGHSMPNEQLIRITELPERYILFVGNRGGYKNWSFMIRALKQLINGSNLKIVCAGGGVFNDAEKKELQALKISRNAIQIDFNDRQLAALYTNALCFIFPSSYEGFGIPILESMQMNCPVVLTKIEVFEEVAGNAGHYYLDKDPTDLKEKVEELLGDDNLREKLIRLGREQVSKYSWEKCAANHLSFYKKVLTELV